MTLLAQISHELGLGDEFVRTLVRTAEHRYKCHQIPKRSGGARTIEHPARPLKAVQRWLLHSVVERFPVHDSAVGFRRGVGLRANAERHRGAHYLVRVDLADFFHSITVDDLRNYLAVNQQTAGWDEAERATFVRLVSRRGRLPIGAPTSPALSNAICFQLDCSVSAFCAAIDVIYTRYADDLTFSAREPNRLRGVEALLTNALNQLQVPRSLRINTSKTIHSSKKKRMLVTGLVLDSGGEISIGRNLKRRIRSGVFKFDTLPIEDKRCLSGLLAFAKGVEPDFINRLILKLGEAQVMRVFSSSKGSR